MGPILWCSAFNLMKPQQNGRHFAGDIFKCTFFNGNCWLFIDWNFTEVWSWGSNWQYVSIDSDKRLFPVRCQSITFDKAMITQFSEAYSMHHLVSMSWNFEMLHEPMSFRGTCWILLFDTLIEIYQAWKWLWNNQLAFKNMLYKSKDIHVLNCLT